MSDINPNRMIPLHVADAAVAACEAEIQKLREENERLRKAGDALSNQLIERGAYYEIVFAIHQWNEAKYPPTDPV